MTRRKFRDGATREALALDPKAWGRYFEAVEPPQPFTKDGIAYVWISGPLEHHSCWWFLSYDEVLRDIEGALASEDARAVILNIDSPGGAAAGMVETHRKIRALRAKYDKPIFAYANECAASAAYGIACAADKIYLPETGHVGSVGVIAVVVDQTARNAKEGYDVRLLTTGARKGDGHPDKPLDDASLEALQSQVDKIGASFFEIVSASRAMSIKAVAKLDAGVFYGTDAVDAGLADGIASFDEFVSITRGAVDALAQGKVSGSSSRQQVGKADKGLEASMDKIVALKLQVEEKKAALLAAKTEKERQAALAAYDVAVEAASKYKKTVVEEEEDDTPAKDEEAEAESESDEKCEDDEDSEAGESKSDSDGEGDAKKALEAKTGLYTYPRLYRLAKQVARRITGDARMTVEQVFSALDQVGTNARRNRKLETRLVKIENERTAEKIDALLERGRHRGQITPSEVEDFRADAHKLGAEWLEKRLAKRPKVVRTLEDGGRTGDDRAVATTDDPLAGRSAAERDIIKRSALKLGKTEAEVAQELDAQMRKQNGASVTRY